MTNPNETGPADAEFWGYPAWYYDIQIESLSDQIANDAKQRQILVDWMADIDERTFRNETELANARRARGPQ